MPAAAIAAWKGPGQEADARRWILGYAILAPHSHNLQSWRVDLGTPDEILLRCDLERLLPESDPFSRQIMMSHGTFLELLDIAARERGLRKAPAPDEFATTSQIKDFGKKLASTPAFLWMVTDGNDRPTQVSAGRAYARVQLAATANGLAMQPLQQALQEYPEQASPYAAIRRLLNAQTTQTVQMWARVGFGPSVEPAPRRGLSAHLV